MNQLCKVCGEPAAGFHFGAFTCEGCKSFFGRTYNNVSGVSECKNGGRCEINKKNRTSCKSCRLRKCLQVGMSKSGSRYGRRSNWFKIHCLLSAQGQNGGMNSLPETNNNNSTVTNNNNANANSSGVNHHHHHTKTLPSTITSHHHHPLGGLGGGHGGHSDGDHRSGGGRERSSSSGASHLPHNHSSSNSNSGPTQFPNLSALSPDSKEQFLSSLNRKMMTPDLFEYFRAANLNVAVPPNGLGPKPYFPEERAEELSSRTSRSPGSLESPNSEASGDDNKGPHLPLFGLPPGSPLDVKPNDILSFDLLTRDLMKLGYDPVRFWPAMLSSPSSLHQFNPYRFMFPNFPGGPGGPPGFPPGMNPLGNGFPLLPPNNGATLLPSAKLLAASAGNSDNLSPSPVPPHTNRRFPIIIPPASSLTLTPPISHHGSDEPNNLSASRKSRKLTQAQDQPIDLSAKTIITNNNNIPETLVRVKGEPSSEESDTSSDIDDNELHSSPLGANRNHKLDLRDETSSDSSTHSSIPIKKEFNIKSELRDSGQDEEDHCDGDDESESFNFSHHHHNLHHHRKRPDRRHSSSSNTSIPLPKKLKVSTPLDLTRPTTNSNPPSTKIAT